MVFGGNSGERAVASALTAHAGARYDFESENFVCGAQSAAQGGPDDNSAQAGHIVAATLGAEHGRNRGLGQENETGLLVYALQHAQIGRADDAGPRGRGYQADLAFTQDSRKDSDAVAGPFGVRRLTPVECERLQAFPDQWTAWGVDENGNRIEMSDSARYRALGNAVNRKVSEWLDRRIVQYGS